MTTNTDLIPNMLDAVLTATTDDDLARAALALVRLAEEAGRAVERAKVRIRDIALERTDGLPDTVILDAHDAGSVAVNIPKPTLRFIGDRDSLRESLGDRYDTYFREKIVVSLATDFRALVENTRDATVRGLLTGAVAEADLTPRVSFRTPTKAP